ncbi:MAG: hypothetical protein EBR88_03870, partial [Betaproteobacteria bacterium]|nr:hypothetical protein [Betaproteobacteria bacterium]
MTKAQLEPIERYLADLQSALAGRDPAIIHDALVDAEIHLRSAVRAGQLPEEAIRAYGSAEEIAQAYGEIPGRQTAPAERRGVRSLPVV